MELYPKEKELHRKLTKAQINELCCPICGRLDLRIMTGEHHCTQKALDNIDKRQRRAEQKAEQWQPDEPDAIEQLNNGLKQYEQD